MPRASVKSRYAYNKKQELENEHAQQDHIKNKGEPVIITAYRFPEECGAT